MQNSTDTLKQVYKALKIAQAKITTLENAQHEGIAIIGVACHFPGGVYDAHSYWQLLTQGKDAIIDVPPTRWQAEQYYDANPQVAGKMYTTKGGFLTEDITGFDHQFFGISPKEVQSLDPQQRLLLETCWEAMENAGINPFTLKGSKTGIFAGISNYDYAMAHWRSGDLTKIDAYSITGTTFSTATGRIAYLFGFEGPNMAIDTACSSSLVATHLACNSLRNKESDLVLVGGVNLILSPEAHIGFCKLQALSPEGYCKSFDASADGLVRSEGCGVIVLKRLSDAIAADDNILAVIKGSAINQDGKSNGFTAPNGLAQQKVIKTALENAQLTPDQVDYVEAHGTGTPIGDPIEIEAINAVYGQAHSMDTPVWVGSVKANIGHAEPAAGMASLIKSVLVLNYGKIPAQLHFNQPNPQIEWNKLAIKIPTQLTDWQTDKKRTLGVSSFGFGGTNSHMIVQEYITELKEDNAIQRPYHLLNLSAKTQAALDELIQRYHTFLSETSVTWSQICYTANISRPHFPYRCSLISQSKEEAIAKLDSYLQHKTVKNLYLRANSTKLNQKIVFLCTGQGSQYPQMGRDLYETNSLFKEIIQQCDNLLKPYLTYSLIDLLYDETISTQYIHQTGYAQVVIFAIEYALAQLWQSWGIKPTIVLGHSVGEYVAACIAGVFSLADGLKLIATRGRLMQTLPPHGSMAAVVANEAKVIEIIKPYQEKIVIAAVNSPENIVISGDKTAISEVLTQFTQHNIPARLLQISQAVHSPLMTPILDDFMAIAAEVQFSTPKIPVISNRTGKVAGQEIATPDYWVQHMKEKVHFHESMLVLDSLGYEIFLEIGATSTLISLGMQCIPKNQGIWLPSLGMNNSLFNMRPQRVSGQNDWTTLLQSLAQLYVQGYEIDWHAFEQEYPQCKVVLPNYPFQKQKHWLSPVSIKNIANQTEFAILSTHSSFNQQDTINSFQEKPLMEQTNLLSEIQQLVTHVSEIEITQDDLDTPLLALGFDSLMLTRLMHSLVRTFDLPFEISWFFQKTDTVNKIIAYLQENGVTVSQSNQSQQVHVSENKKVEISPPPTVTHQQQSLTTTAQEVNSGNVYEKVIAQQLQLMAQQLELLKHTTSQTDLPVAPSKFTTHLTPNTIKTEDKPRPHLRAMKFEKDELTAQQIAFINDFIAKYNRKTQKSKQYAQKYRPILADWINSLNFRPSIKELIYPIVHDHSQGAKIWDIDGNEYLDLAMGYGVNFFGNSPDFIRQALTEQVSKGFELGPQSDQVGEVAQLISELTGVERVAFCNTGSEAVMVALRVARTATKRSKIVLFAGSYHGSFDGVLAETTEQGTIPTTPGTTQNMVNDVLVLNYGTDAALETIYAHRHELAAVLVEPVQSRKPALQPQAFLQKLRQLTEESNITLIFDEVLTGFRPHSGGCQAWFNIKADIVTYGKIVGGGMPIGIVAGKRRYMDVIDGGEWQFGDHSYPQSDMTVFAGTFCKHPLSIAVAKACLLKMKQEGSELQAAVNRRMQYLADHLNTFFQQENVAIQLNYFASVFRFESFGRYSLVLQPIEMELFFNLLLAKGVYTWERRICFLSIAHTDQDIDWFIRQVKDTIAELRAGGFALEADTQTWQTTQLKKNDIIRTYPLSSAQKRLFVLESLEKERNTYQIAQALIATGQLDQAKLTHCIKQLIDRHDILRTSFEVLEDGELVQRVYPQVEFIVDYHEAETDNIDNLITHYNQMLKLDKPPVFRTYLVKLEQQRYLLLFITHHLVIDGLSWNVFVQELTALYQGNALIPLEKNYEDYVHWQTIQHTQWQQQEQYWLAKFADELPLLQLPTDYPRPSILSPQGSILYTQLNKDETKQLRILAKNHGLTMNMLLLAVYQLLLHKLTGQTDFIIGIPTSGRPPQGFERVLGMFANTMAVRNQLGTTQRVNEFFQIVKQNLLQDYPHQDYPFELLVENLQLARDLSRNALFDTMFVYEKADERIFNLAETTFIVYDLQKDAVHFDLILEIIEQSDTLYLHFEYNTHLFQQMTIERWSEYFKALLRIIINNAQQSIATLDYIPTIEKQQLLHDFNQTTAEYPKNDTLVSLFEAQVAKTPDAIAVQFKDKQLTYQALNQQVNHIVHDLSKTYTIQPDERIALLLPRSEMTIVGILTALKMGAAYVPIDINYPKERILYILQDSDCKFIISEQSVITNLDQEIINQVPIIDIRQCNHENNQNPLTTLQPEHLAYIIYTSGSTGQPKGVLIEHHSAINSIYWRIHYYHFSNRDKVLQLPAYTFDSAVMDIFTTLLSGACTVVIEAEHHLDAEYLGRLIQTANITHFLITPSFYKTLLYEISHNMKALRCVTVAGDTIHSDLVQLHFEKLPQVMLYNEYGPTENSICSTACQLSINYNQTIIGYPITNNRIYIIDQNQQLCPIGVMGEICVAGVGLARGYLNRPELTAEKFIPLPVANEAKVYRTGDQGRWLPDGNIEFLGRIDGQVKIRGFRIELGEIEKQLLSHEFVKQATIIPKNNQQNHLELVAYFVSNQPLTGESLRQYLQNKLPDYMIPSFFVSLDQLPLTSHGKVDKKALPIPDETALLTTNYQAPRDAIEQILVDIWEKVLGRSQISIYDNYFMLGGDSIKAIQVLSRLRKANLTLQIRDIFQYPTIAELKTVVQITQRHIDQNIVVGHIPLTAIQTWFFQFFSEYNHFNQSVILSAKPRFVVSTIEQVLLHWQQHHDALRMTYIVDGNQIIQENHGIDYPIDFTIIDLRQQAKTSIDYHISQIQANIDLAHGPLLKVVLFHLDNIDQLLIVIHHLVVDGVSWRILLEDFLTLYQQISAGKTIELPLKTDSFKRWSEKIQEFSQSARLLQEFSYWQKIAAHSIAIPVDMPSDINYYRDTISLDFQLSIEETQQLLIESSHAYNTYVDELLLIALAISLQKWCGQNQFLVALEGHGRENLFNDVDVSRTVGWFTSVYPILLEIPENDDLAYQIKFIKEMLRNIPNKGVGYSQLRYLSQIEKHHLSCEPQISFNYLGEFNEVDNPLFELNVVDATTCIAPQLTRPYLLDVESMVIKGQLQVTIYYNLNQYHIDTIQHILSLFHQMLRTLITHCQQKTTTELTPADLTYSGLSLEELDDIFN